VFLLCSSPPKPSTVVALQSTQLNDGHGLLCWYRIAGSLVPRPHSQEGKGLGTLKHFLSLAHHHVTARAPIQTNANNHMIAELAEPRISANVPRAFPRVRGWGLGTRLYSGKLSREKTFTNFAVWEPLHPRKFSPWNLGMLHPPTLYTIDSMKCSLPTDPRKFSPSNISRYTV
jgi:hypothetical protein